LEKEGALAVITCV